MLSTLFSRIQLTVETEETFGDIAIMDEAYYIERTNSLLLDFQEICKNVSINGNPNDSGQLALNFFNEVFSENSSAAQRNVALDVLFAAFESKFLPATKAIEQLFEYLRSIESPSHYRLVFVDAMSFIQRIMPLLTYKDCQNVLCHFLASLKYFKNCSKSDKVTRAASRVLSIFFNREEPVLPTFLVYGVVHMTFGHMRNDDEMKKWIFYKDVFGYHESFRPLARLFTIAGRVHMRPVLQHTHCHLTPIHYKLDSIALTFRVSDTPLPFEGDLLLPMNDWMKNWILEPFCSQMPEKALLIPEKPGTRRVGLERCCVDIAMDLLCTNTFSDEACVNIANNLNILFTRGLLHVSSFVKNLLLAIEKKGSRPIRNPRYVYLILGNNLLLGTIFNHHNQLAQNQQAPELGADCNVIIKIDEFISNSDEAVHSDETRTLSLVNANQFNIARSALWNALLHRLRTLKHPDVTPPTDVQKALSSIQCPTPIPPDSSRLFLVNLINSSIPSDEAQKRALNCLIENLNNSSLPHVTLVGNCTALGELSPLDMSLIKSLFPSSRVMLCLSIIQQWKNMTPNFEKATRTPVPFFSPALIETYARLYVDCLFEALHLRMIDEVIMASTKQNSTYRTFPIILELIIHFVPHYNPQGLLTLYQHCINIMRQGSKVMEYSQFYLALESSCIAIMSSFGVKEFNVQMEKTIQSNQVSGLISIENEDYNKLLMLNVIRSMSISGVDCFDKRYQQIFETVQQVTPHVLSCHVLTSVPAQIQSLYCNSPYFQSEIYQKLKNDVELEYSCWKKLRNDADMISHFSNSARGHYFICILYKLLISDEIPPLVSATILERIGPKNLTKHIRSFCDFVICELLANMSNATRSIAAINRLIWEFNVVSIDRFLFALVLRPFAQKEDKVSVYMLYLFLSNCKEFKERVDFFCSNYNPNASGLFAARQQAFVEKYQESFFFEGLYRFYRKEPQAVFYFPTYVTNVCVRFLPIFDIIIHRFLEIPDMLKHLQPILANYGNLLKFHRKPISYLYQTIAYYKKTIAPEAVRLLITTMHEAFTGLKAAEWLVSLEFLSNAVDNSTFLAWNPAPSYLSTLIEKLTLAIVNPSKCEPYCQLDWCTQELTSVSSHLLYSISLELLSVPNMPPSTLAATLFDLALHDDCSPFNEYQRLNSVSLLLNNLPPNYSSHIDESLVDLINSFHVVSLSVEQVFEACSSSDLNNPIKSKLVVVHSLLYHANSSHLNFARQMFTEKVKPYVTSEQQLVLFCHMLSPLLLRYADNKPILSAIYSDVIDSLRVVGTGAKTTRLLSEDFIVDLLYFGKYNCLGDDLKSFVDSAAASCSKSLQTKLQFY